MKVKMTAGFLKSFLFIHCKRTSVTLLVEKQPQVTETTEKVEH